MSRQAPDPADWLEPEDFDEDAEDVPIAEHDLTSTPNDFNVGTIVDFLSKGVFRIPAFQRHFVWDLRRASKLIESLLMGLPVPQVFLYEQGRNRYLVIDGQQRLMSIRYFKLQRFPRIEHRALIRRLSGESLGGESRDLIDDDAYFHDFHLSLSGDASLPRSRFDGLTYDTLGDDKTAFDLRTIRCVVIRQNRSDGDDSSVYEIFNRLNTGGVNLTAQEIRISLYHSDFYRLAVRLNALPHWRRLIGLEREDLRMRDIELLVRGFAMLRNGATYEPPMTRFLNVFSKRMRKAPPEDLAKLETIFTSFLEAAGDAGPETFGMRSKRMNAAVFEAVFAAACEGMDEGVDTRVDASLRARVLELKADQSFSAATGQKTSDPLNVQRRLEKARSIIQKAVGSDAPDEDDNPL